MKTQAKKEESASRSPMVSHKAIEKLYPSLMNELVVKERFKESNLTAGRLAKELHTSARYVSGFMAIRFNCNFNQFVNHHRVKRVIFLMKDKHYDKYTCEELGLMCGFANRQTFYRSFNIEEGVTPLDFRREIKKER